MATKLLPGKVLQREIVIDDMPVVVSLTATEIHFRIPGTINGTFCSWKQAVQCSKTPPNVPSHLYGEPLEFLKYQHAKKESRKSHNS